MKGLGAIKMSTVADGSLNDSLEKKFHARWIDELMACLSGTEIKADGCHLHKK